MKKYIFVDIDTQNDFILNTGALTAKAEEIIPALGRLTDFARENGIPILSSQDTHIHDDPEFRHFPPHCVKGTSGYEKAASTILPDALKIGIKNEGIDWKSKIAEHGQLIFEKNNLDIFTNPNFENIVHDSDADQFVVYGIATEYCVKIVVMGLLKRGKKVVVLTDAIKAINDDTGKAALEEMTKAGAELAVLEDIIGNK
jgi:nicotinamidase/pyrazinamidase